MFRNIPQIKTLNFDPKDKKYIVPDTESIENNELVKYKYNKNIDDKNIIYYIIYICKEVNGTKYLVPYNSDNTLKTFVIDKTEEIKSKIKEINPIKVLYDPTVVKEEEE